MSKGERGEVECVCVYIYSVCLTIIMFCYTPGTGGI